MYNVNSEIYLFLIILLLKFFMENNKYILNLYLMEVDTYKIFFLAKLLQMISLYIFFLQVP